MYKNTVLSYKDKQKQNKLPLDIWWTRKITATTKPSKTKLQEGEGGTLNLEALQIPCKTYSQLLAITILAYRATWLQ